MITERNKGREPQQTVVVGYMLICVRCTLTHSYRAISVCKYKHINNYNDTNIRSTTWT